MKLGMLTACLPSWPLGDSGRDLCRDALQALAAYPFDQVTPV